MLITHFLKIAGRRLARPDLFAVVNVLGLTLGTVCTMYMLLYIWKQYRYDRHHEAGDRLFRVVTDVRQANDEWWRTATSSPPIAPALKEDFPEVEEVARLVAGWEEQIIRYRENTRFVDKGYYVDSTFFDLFTYHFLEGTPESALDGPNTVVLTRGLADLLFAGQAAFGREITVENNSGKTLFRVSGVVDESRTPSHIRGNFYMAMNSGGIGEYVMHNQNWAGNNFIHSYIRLGEKADPAALEDKLPAFLQDHGPDRFRENPAPKILHLEPVREIHLYADREHQVDTTVSARFLFILFSIAVLIQVIACINFMNLTTARSTRRGKEVGVRKVIGAGRTSLILQFLGESVALSIAAIGLAVPLLNVLLPQLNAWTGADVDPTVFQRPAVWMLTLALAVVTGLLAGTYPDFYQSAFEPLQVLKGGAGNRGGVVGMRRGLVVFQFVISISLVLAVTVINGQMDFIRTKDLGFAPERKMLLPFRTPESRKALQAVKNELARLPGINAVAAMANYPGQFVPYDFNVYPPGKDPGTAVNTKFSFVDEDYLKIFNIDLHEGRNFTPADTVDQVLVNETFLRRLNIPLDQAVGQRVMAQQEEGEESFQIIGVMQDYHIESLYEPIIPFMLFYSGPQSGWLSQVAVSTDQENYQVLVNDARAIWEDLLTGIPFDYAFLDENLNKQYEGDLKLFAIIGGFTGMALLISCLGLLGLSVFNAEQRVKEIGIRKVLGAGVGNVVTLLSREFLLMVGLAAVLAFPLAWWGMNQWLNAFAYRIAMKWWMFAGAGLSAVLIALLTVGGYALRAALRNPVEALRHE